MSYKKILLFSFCMFLIMQSFSQTNTKKWRKTENDSMASASLLFDEANYLMALPMYENLYNGHPKEEYLKYCYGRCGLYRSDKHEMALTLLSEVYEKNKKVENIEYDLARAKHYNFQFDEAIVLLEKYLLNKKNTIEAKKNANQLMKYCINAKALYANPTNAKIENAGNVLNTPYEEYVPIISADESIMIYTYRGVLSMGGLQNAFLQPDPYGVYYEDVYQSNKENGSWTAAKSIPTINSNTHDAAIALSADGNQLFVYRDSGDDHGDIYVSYFTNNEWTVPQKLKGDVNSYSWEGSCSLSANGKQLYFSSERGGGYGGKDIYRATLQADSTWGNVINLGDTINTALDDDAPFIHPDGVTLFYSSKGKNSMGGYDIFQSRLNWMDSTFSSPINMGYPINTPDEDIYYVLSANGERGYYASGKKGGQGLKDIYTVYPGYVGKKPSVYVLKGKITTELQPSEGTITVEATNNGNRKFGVFKSNSLTGNYVVSLPQGGQFLITYTYKNFAPKILEVNTQNLEGYGEKIFDINYSVSDTAKPAITVLAPKDSSISVVLKKEIVKQLVTKKEVVKETTIKKDVVKKDVVKTPKNNEVIARNPAQIKNKIYADKYNDISADGIEFRVQIAAYKYPKNYVYKHLDGMGEVQNLLLNDGITRITIGGKFNTIGEAFIHCEKVIGAGQTDAFVTVIYKGDRIFLEDLEKMGIYVKK